ncbi:MAG: helix-turn-helix domain-containing protein, partial [Candidatus Aminicenantales bacterium]
MRKSRPSKLKPDRPMLQRELANEAHIPASSLCNIENGKYKNPTWLMLSKIAKGLNCDISEFFVTNN